MNKATLPPKRGFRLNINKIPPKGEGHNHKNRVYLQYIRKQITMETIIRITITFLLVSLMSVHGMAQQRNSDTLEAKLKQKDLSIKEELSIYDDLSWEYLDKDFEKSKQMAQEGLILARQSKDRSMEVTLMRNLGVAYYMNNKLDTAESILLEALAISKNDNNSLPQAAVFAALGNLYNVQNKSVPAIKHYNKALHIYEQAGIAERVYVINSNIGVLYSNRRNYPQAEKYLLAARKSAIAASDTGACGRTDQNLSNLYFVISKPKEAYQYAKEAVEYCRKVDDNYNEVLALTSLSGACHTYLKNNNLAMQYAEEALQKAREENMPNLISASLRSLSFAHYRNADYRQAINAAQECIALTDSTDLPQLIAVNATLLESYIHVSERVKAEETFHYLFDLMTLQSDEQVSQALAEMEIQYETEKKEATIITLSQEKKLLSLIVLTLLIAVVFLAIALILFNRYQRQKRLRAEEQLRAFEMQKHLLVAEWLVDGENRERTRISRELHDGLGGILTIAKLKLSQSETSSSVITLIDNAITEMRRISSNLMPDMLGRSGLRPTLSEYCKTAPIIDLYFYGEDLRYDLSIEMNLYRIACELINNALKHSEATLINVQLITEVERISLIVQDNGKGFDITNASGNGLSNIKNRASFMGASLEIFSSESKGTEITVELKMNTSK